MKMWQIISIAVLLVGAMVGCAILLTLFDNTLPTLSAVCDVLVVSSLFAMLLWYVIEYRPADVPSVSDSLTDYEHDLLVMALAVAMHESTGCGIGAWQPDDSGGGSNDRILFVNTRVGTIKWAIPRDRMKHYWWPYGVASPVSEDQVLHNAAVLHQLIRSMTDNMCTLARWSSMPSTFRPADDVERPNLEDARRRDDQLTTPMPEADDPLIVRESADFLDQNGGIATDDTHDQGYAIARPYPFDGSIT